MSVHVSGCTYVCMCVSARMSVYMCGVHMDGCEVVWIGVCMYALLDVCVSVHMCMSTCMHVNVHMNVDGMCVGR